VLKHLWLHLHQIYFYIPSLDKQYLKDYYQLAGNLTDTELLVYRRDISQLQPNLPQRAGRALAKLDKVAASWDGLSQFDIEKFVGVFIQLAQSDNLGKSDP
jgi:hypothetical protein